MIYPLSILTFILVYFGNGSAVHSKEILKLNQPESYESKVVVVTNRSSEFVDSNQIAYESQLSEEQQLSYLSSYYQGGEWIFETESSLSSLFADDLPFSDWMVFVHGDGKTLLSTVERAQELQELHQVNVLVFSWPSKDPELGAIKNFKTSYANVQNSVASFVTLIKQLGELRQSSENPFRDDNLTLFLHSLGNYYLERMYAEGSMSELEVSVFDNLIINAAAVEAENHHLWVESIKFAERIYINSNDDDFSLSGLRFLTKLGRQLGESPVPPYASNAIYINFTAAVGFNGSMGPSHSYFFATITDKSQNIRSYYTTIFHGNAAPLSDPDLFAYFPDEDTYFIIF